MNKYILALIFILFHFYSQAQKQTDSTITEIVIGYNNDKTLFYYPVSKSGHDRVIYFFNVFKDSVSIYLNDKIIFNKWINTIDDNRRPYQFNLKGIKKNKFYIIKIILPSKQTSVEFPLDNRYSTID